MRSLLIALAGLGLIGLGGCADYLAVDGQGHTTAAPPKPATTATVAPVKGDTCGAAALQYLVGKANTEAPPPVDPSKRRVYCSACHITMDYRSDRVNIVFDKETGNITEVKCG